MTGFQKIRKAYDRRREECLILGSVLLTAPLFKNLGPFENVFVQKAA